MVIQLKIDNFKKKNIIVIFLQEINYKIKLIFLQLLKRKKFKSKN